MLQVLLVHSRCPVETSLLAGLLHEYIWLMAIVPFHCGTARVLQNLDFDHLRTIVPLGAFQRQLRPRRVDGTTPRHLLCGDVYSAGLQLPLEGTDMILFAQWSQSRFCNAGCATVKWRYSVATL